MSSKRSITIYHSPDSDDAFMFYGLVQGVVNDENFEFYHELSDIESLNQRTLKAELEVSAASVHAFAYLNNRYAILRVGASMGGVDYGPRLIAKQPLNLNDGKSRIIAIPGQLTSAALAIRIYLHDKGIPAELVCANFDRVQELVKSGEVDAGVIIHEGQLTHQKEGLVTLVDLGAWWWEVNRLPLPLGVNIVRKDIGCQAMQAVSRALKLSIDYSLNHRKAALDYALKFGRGITFEEADRFVAMYVNERTRDIGSEGIESITKFLKRASDLQFIPNFPQLEFI